MRPSLCLCFALALLHIDSSPRALADPIVDYNAALQSAAQFEAAGDLELAVVEARRLPKLLPDRADGYYYLARLLRESGELTAAIENYQRGILLDPDRQAQAFWNIAYSHVRWSERLEAETNLVGAIRQMEEAIAILERLSRPPDVEVLRDVDPPGTLQAHRQRLQFLRTRLRADDLAAAEDAVARAAAYRERGRADLAQRDLLNAVDLEPGNAAAWEALGKSHAAAGEFAAAAEACRKAVEIDPQAKTAWNALGVNEDERLRFPEAVEAFDKALAIDPEYTLALTNLALAYQKKGNYEKAVETYNRALAVESDNAVALFNLAAIDVAFQNYDQALSWCSRLLRAQPFHLKARLMTGDVCLVAGRLDEAVAAYRKALLVAPDNEQARQSLDRAVQARDQALLQRYIEDPALRPSADTEITTPSN
jgi:tetratricopeptide (TPR) repeat protein